MASQLTSLPHSHPSGQAVERLNLKPSNMRDLITDEPFTRADLVTLQDPTDLDKFNMSTFHHIKHSLSAEEEEGQEGVGGESIERCCSCFDAQCFLCCQRRSVQGGTPPTT